MCIQFKITTQFLLDRVHFWIREEQPRFSYSSYSPGTPCKILDPKDQNSKTVNHFEFEGKLKKIIKGAMMIPAEFSCQ